MANYYETCRTNYFRVTDEEKYKELFENLCSEDEIHDFTKIKNGTIWHGFGSYAPIDYCQGEDEDDCNFDTFLKEIRKILPEDEAFVLIAAGYEKLRYVMGYAVVATRNDIKHIHISNEVLKAARTMLKDPDWTTAMEY